MNEGRRAVESVPYPFFLAVDDGGSPNLHPDGTGPEISFDAYENIPRLAQEFELRIPICFTTRFLDVNNVSGYGEPVGYADQQYYETTIGRCGIGFHWMSTFWIVIAH